MTTAKRRIEGRVRRALGYQAAVGIIGPRQVGKTTLARQIGDEQGAIYLDLEDSADRRKLDEPRLFLEHYRDRLVILDKIHRLPELFHSLRGIIDRGRREGRPTGRFLILGSASIDLLRQSGESLAGRIAYVDMGPLDILEVPADTETRDRLWVRGGYPNSYLASDDKQSFDVRRDFIRTYLPRDVAEFAQRLPVETLERLWTMLAYRQGRLLNASRLANELGISAQTVTRYIDLLTELQLLRRLTPYRANISKRLVKSPKVYVRDSGLLHALLGLPDYNTLAGHPIVSGSWEGFVIENLLAAAPAGSLASFYRTTAGAEIALVLELPGASELWAIEIKQGLSAKPRRGFHNAREDLKPTRSFVVYSGDQRYPVTDDIEAIGLRELAELLSTGGG